MAAAAEITQPRYWRDHVRRPVRFEEAMHTLGEQGQRLFLEIGPNPMLLAMGQRCLPDDEGLWLPSLREGWEDWQQILESLGALYVQGLPVDWDSFDRPYHRQRVPLPTYPWDRKPYWWMGARAPAVPKKTAAVWERAVEAGHRQSQQVPLDLEISTYARKWEALNRLATSYMTNALLDLGIFTTPGEHYTLDALLQKGHILTTYRSLVTRWLMLLAASGAFQHAPDGTITKPQPLSRQSMEAAWGEARAVLDDIPFVADYVRDCGERLASILVGAESPLEMMFPGGSMARAEALYQDWAHARYFHYIVRAVTEGVINAASSKPLRILEVGAGTGATTSSVLPVLPLESGLEGLVYHFTDVSDLFLERAREKFKPYPFVRYGLLDIEKDARLQGYGSHQFDVVIAANVLHATRDLSVTLLNVRSLLSPTGILLLFEATHHQPWYDVTTGLIEGWQSFGDDLRTDSPLLSADQWTQILKAEGFVDVVAFPEAGSPAEILGEHVILARPPTHVGETAALADLKSESNSDSQFEIPAATPDSGVAGDLLRRLREAVPDERKEILLEIVRAHVSSVLRLDPDDPPDRRARLMDLGVDSLMAVELRGRLSRSLDLERKLPATLIFDYPTIEAITDFLLREALVIEEIESPSAPMAAPVVDSRASQSPTSTAVLESLTDDEVEALLLEKLKKLK
jgi:SAM-dependent methyltransferase